MTYTLIHLYIHLRVKGQCHEIFAPFWVKKTIPGGWSPFKKEKNVCPRCQWLCQQLWPICITLKKIEIKLLYF